jgi:hypothetical protein
MVEPLFRSGWCDSFRSYELVHHCFGCDGLLPYWWCPGKDPLRMIAVENKRISEARKEEAKVVN